MKTRYVFPELFYAAGAPILVEGRERLSLRWILHPAIGLPRALFHIWRFAGDVSFKQTSIVQQPLERGMLISWPEGPCVAVKLIISVPSGSVVVSAFSAARGAGHMVDQKTIAGPVPSFPVTLVGSPLASIMVMGNANILDAAVIPIYDFVNDPNWTLVERVGLPASMPTFDGSGYPLDMQGPVGAEIDPVFAAIQRVRNGTPDVGWPAVTDRGTSVQSFMAPEPDALVLDEMRPLVESVAELLKLVPDPSKHADHELNIVTTAPRSIHGVDAPPNWQAQARPSKIKLLGNLLLSAGADAFSALALGFGTTLDKSDPQGTIGLPQERTGLYMITVMHKVTLEILAFPIPITFKLNGELAALYLGERPASPPAPAGLQAATPTTYPRLDPPGHIDGPWLEVGEISWSVPVTLIATVARTSGYAIARGVLTNPMEIRTEKRLAGGWTSFIPASSANSDQPVSVRFAESGLPEALPGDPPHYVYSVAAHDWFGRWSPWNSIDYPRTSIAAQIPAMRKVELAIENSGGSIYNTSALIEFTWDWSHRRPAQVHLRVLVYSEGTTVPDVPGSVLSVGGPIIPDNVLDFSSASKDSPPTGVELVTEETIGNLRTYRIEVNGIVLDFGSHSKIQVTVRARAAERVVPTRLSNWSPDMKTTAASPIPAPPPFVPAAMWWASIPDPQGIARTTLRWADTALMYAVYMADETALRRELNQPSADLEIPAADRLPGLRLLDFAAARRAFRRIADRIPANSLEVELPRGSGLIHFYGIVPISSTGVEGTLPASSNSYFAVAARIIKTPEVPVLRGRDQDGEIAIFVEVPEIRVPVGRIEIFRAPSRHRAVSIDQAGPPFAILDASLGVRSGDSIRWELNDPAPGPAWQSVYYRAVAYGTTDLSRGEFGGKSSPSPAIEVVPGSPFPPPITDLIVEDVATEPANRLVSFISEVTSARTPRGVHVFTIRTVAADASVTTRRAVADTLPLISVTLPTPADQPDLIFRYDPANPRTGRIYAWVPEDIRAVVVEVTDPAGKTTRETWEAP